MMGIPSFILDLFAALMLLVAAVSAARLIADRPWRLGMADADAAHVLMGIAMAGMLVAGLTTLPNGVWVVIFAIMTAWFAWCVYRESRGLGARVALDSHRSPHLVHSAAMVYMFAAVSTVGAGHDSGMSGMGGASGMGMQTLSAPVVAFIFILLLVGYVVVDLDRLSGPAPHGQLLTAPADAVPASAVLAGATAAGGSMSAMVAPERSEGIVPTATAGAADPGTPASDGRGAAGSARSILLNPKTAAGCRIAMGVTMALMLAIMI